MTFKRFLCGVGVVAMAWGQARADDPVMPPAAGDVEVAQGGKPQTPQTPVAPTPPATTPALAQPPSDAFVQPPPAGGEMAATSNPQMLGDSLSYIQGVSSPLAIPGPFTKRLPSRALAGSAFKIANNEGVAPDDRVFLNVNYFTRVLHSLQGYAAPQQRLGRQVFGFEKTFMDGDASFGMRAPFFQIHDSAGGSSSDFGDVTLIGKFALINDQDGDSSRVVSVGAALTLPTGPNDIVGTESINPFIFQPYVGLRGGTGDLYVHGYSSMAFALSDAVPNVWFNDVGVGYYAYRGDGCVASIIPTVEAHLTTGFSHQGANASGIATIDTLNTVLGLHVMFTGHANLTFGYGFPWTGPQPFESEYILQFNYYF